MESNVVKPKTGVTALKQDSPPGTNSVPALDSNATSSFGSLLQKFGPNTDAEKLFGQGLKTTAEDDLRNARKDISKQIRQAIETGNTDLLHKYQDEYDSLTAELRTRAENAVVAAAESHDILPLPIANPTSSKAEGISLKTETLSPASSAEPKVAIPTVVTNSEDLTKNSTSKLDSEEPAKPLVIESTEGNLGVPPLGTISKADEGISSPSQVVKGNQEIPSASPAPNAAVPSAVPKLTPPSEEHSSLPPTGSVGAVTQSSPSSNIFGVSDVVWEKISRDDHLRTTLLAFPKEAVDLYKETSPQEKLDMAKRLSEKTHVMFFTIDNREAFVTGQVMGRDTFAYLQGMIDQQASEGKISMDQAMRQKSGLNVMKTLSPEQREGYLKLLQADTQAVASN